jgi:carotenoid cleavage dioxygenase
VANTHVLEHAGRLLALVESGFPYELTPELDTVGPCDFGGRLRTAMTAHPKCDPVTGDLHFFGYDALPPHLTYHRLSATGELVCSVEVPGAGPSMMHDFAITDRHALFLDLPVTFQIGLLGRGLPYAWDDGYPARIGVMELARPGPVRWFPVEPGYVFHVGGAHTDPRGRIVLDGCRYTPADTVAMWAGWADSRVRLPRPPPSAWPGCTAGCSTSRPARSSRPCATSVRSSSRPWTTGSSAGPPGTCTPCPTPRSCTTTRPAR